MPSLDAQVEALAIALIELAKILSKEQQIGTPQLANAMETAAKNSKVDRQTMEAVSELARRLR